MKNLFIICFFICLVSYARVGSIISEGDNKIDNQATLGLNGVHNSLAYRVHEIEKHFHGREKWLGDAASADGETHVADRVGGATAAFTFVSGNNDFGDWVQIIGSTDTPIQSGYAYFDAHRFLVTTTNSTLPFIVQVAGGEAADLATLVAAEMFTEMMYIASTNNNDSGIEDIMTSRVPAGTKVWARVACIGADAKTLNAYIGIHEYEN